MRSVRAWRLLVWWPVLLGLALVFVGVEIAVLAGQWDVVRSWASLVEAVDGAFLVLGILVAGAAAALAGQPWENRELTAALPDAGPRTVAAAGVVVGFVAAGVHALTVAALLIWGYAVGLPGQPRLWPVLSVLAGLMACALFGTAVVRLGAGALAPLLAMGLWVAVIYGFRAFGGTALVDLGGVSVVLVGVAPDTAAMLWRAAWLVAAAAVVWWIAAYGRRVLRRPVFGVLVIVAGVLAVTTEPKVGAGFVQTSVVWVCEPGPPQVCLAAEYDDRLADYAAALSRMAPFADQVGLPRPPDGYRQAVGIRGGPGSFGVEEEVQTVQLAFDLVQFALPCSVRWSLPQLEQADVVAFWIVTQAGIPLAPQPPGFRVPTLDEARQALDSLRCDR